MSFNPSWPSLYDPALEIGRVQHRQPIQTGGYYLSDPHEVFRFTLYWMLIFHLPLFFLCGTYAFLNLTFPPSQQSLKSIYPLSTLRAVPAGHDNIDASSQLDQRITPPRANEGRSRLTFAILVLLGFLTLSLMNAVIGAAVVGYVLVGVFNAAHFNMSTWVPCVWAIITVLLSILGIWPSVIDIL